MTTPIAETMLPTGGPAEQEVDPKTLEQKVSEVQDHKKRYLGWIATLDQEPHILRGEE